MVTLGVAGLVIVGLLVALLMVVSDRNDVKGRFDELASEQKAEEEALLVAREFLNSFVNFDAETIDADFDRIISYATGEFQQEVDSFNDPKVRKGMRDREVHSRGEIVKIYVQGIEKGQARIFAVVDQTIQNNEPRITNDELRVELGLVNDDGVWKVFDVALLQAGGTAGSGDLPPAGTVPTMPDSTTTTTEPG